MGISIMMLNRFILRLLSLFLFAQQSVATELDLTFFDVGQGNCTVITCPKGPPLLVDAGSSSLRGHGNTFEKDQITSIVSKIEKALPGKQSDDFPDLNVVVSHGDADHLNWIQKILEELKSSNNENILIHYLLGGSPKDYAREFNAFIDNERSENKQKYVFASEYTKASEDIIIKCGPEVLCKILGSDSQSKEKNTQSIVLKLTYGLNSVILTGDATRDTTKAIIGKTIIGCDEEKSGDITILQASHHGADTDGSNSKKWFDAIAPSHLVISAGINFGYLHPKSQTLQFALESSSICSSACHYFLYAGDIVDHKINAFGVDIKTFMSGTSGYHACIVSRCIYSTMTQGNMSFAWKKADQGVSLKVAHTESVSDAAQKDLIIEAIERGSFKIALDEVRCLYLESLNLNVEDITRLSRCISESISLIDLSHNPIDCVDRLERIIASSASLRDLSLCGISLKAEEKEKLEKAWGYRGLDFGSDLASASS